jgi:hypothetical protein
LEHFLAFVDDDVLIVSPFTNLHFLMKRLSCKTTNEDVRYCCVKQTNEDVRYCCVKQTNEDVRYCCVPKTN